MEITKTRKDAFAERALENYDLPDAQLSFIRHNETITYKVTSAGSGAYLLRIHLPLTTALGTHGANLDMVQSELAWLLALRAETDLVLQKPVRNRSGELVTRIPAEDGSLINCSLLSWIEGEPYLRDLETEETARQIGTTLASMHEQSSRWEIPAGFTRPVRDIPYFYQMLDGLTPAVNDGRISASDHAELSRSIELLTGMMHGMDESRDVYGLMHADTHKGNMLIHEGKIRMIDFSFCAFGNYMFDLGICFSDMKAELHHSCLQGYQSVRKLPENYRQLVEGFFIGSVVGTFSFWVANPATQEILSRKLPAITRDFAARFNQNERFWF